MKTDNFLFYHNMDTCIGCGACQVACKDHNNLPAGTFFRRVAVVTLPDGTSRFYSGACNHCREPACMDVCPNGAYTRGADGTVRHDSGKCIGCGRCVWACPYGAVSLHARLGVAQKCLGCPEVRGRGEEPPCVAACINRSLKWGTTDGRCREQCLSTQLPGSASRDTKPQSVVNIVGRGDME